jgi:hypothetical protein
VGIWFSCQCKAGPYEARIWAKELAVQGSDIDRAKHCWVAVGSIASLDMIS